MKDNKYDEQIKDWDFSYFNIETEKFTNWDLYKKLEEITNKNSRILDLGTGGGEKLLSFFPKAKEILATDFSKEMINTAEKNLKQSGRKNITFRIMNNLEMNTPENYFDVVVARNTETDPKQIYKTLKKNGYILIHGVDKMDCWELKRVFNKGQGYNDIKPISQIDYENVLDAGFYDVELIPIHEIEYYKTIEELIKFLFKVPILDDPIENNSDTESYYKKEIDIELLKKYVNRNTTSKGIRLIRRYYGIIGKK